MSDRFEDEIRSHIEHETDALIASGVPPDEARAQAKRRFGNVTAAVERRWESRRWMPGERLSQDLRFAARWMRRAPGFVAVVVFSLAAGIGANTAIFSAADQLLRRPLAVRDPSELRIVMRDSGSLSYPLFQALGRQTVFSEMTAAGGATKIHDVRVEGAPNPQFIRVQDVDASYFRVLGPRMEMGRGLAADGEAAVSHAFWRDRMQSDPSALLRNIWIDGHSFRVVGIVAPEFTGDAPGAPSDAWTPVDPARRISPRENFLKIYGRIRPGVSNRAAAAELSGIYANFQQEPKARMFVSDGSGGWRGAGRFLGQPIQLISWMSALLLVLACLNVANLLLARSSARRAEIGARLALGCGRARLVRQLLTESLLLAGFGAAAGIAAARAGAEWIGSMLTLGNEDVVISTAMDLRVLGFSALIAIFSGLLFGVIPAWRSSRLHPGERASTPRFTAAKALLAAQVAISMVLLTGAAMLGRSVWNVLNTPTGIDAASVLIAEVNSFLKVRAPATREAMTALRHRLESIPGVERASLSLFAPMTRSNSDSVFQREDGSDKSMRQMWVTPEYFTTLGIPVLRGRAFDPSEEAGAAAVLSARAAAILFPGSDPIGKLLRGHQGRDPRRIVGVVEDARFDGPRRDPVPMVYEPIAGSGFGFLSAAVRTHGDPAQLIPAFREALQEEQQVVRSIRTLPQQVERTAAAEIAVARLAAVLGLLSLAVAGLGLYGTMAYTVARRTREIGVRVALGDRPSGVLARILRESASAVAVGVAAGVPLAVAARPMVEKFLFGIGRIDTVSFVIAAAVLLVTALAAGFAPALRASRINPVEALRAE